MLTAIGVVVAFAELVLRVVVAFAKLVLRVISWLARKVSPPTSVEPDSQDVIAELERLAKLRDSGALTKEEFEEQKAKLLAS